MAELFKACWLFWLFADFDGVEIGLEILYSLYDIWMIRISRFSDFVYFSEHAQLHNEKPLGIRQGAETYRLMMYKTC